MRILVFGSNGQVGRALRRLEWPDGAALVLADRVDADLSQSGNAAALIRKSDCQIVVNAAAYTAVDKAESEPELAYAINGEAPGEMAAACAEAGVPFLHISTDFVFDGRKDTAYLESDAVNPMSVYGASKAAGERAVLDVGGRAIILRTSWVFSADGGNFVKTMLRLGRERETLGIVDDQRGCPTSAAGIARALQSVAKRLLSDANAPTGLFHFTGSDAVTWYGFAGAIFEEARRIGGESWLGELTVRPIATSDYPTPAVRPANSVLDCSRIGAEYAIRPNDWRSDLHEVVGKLMREFEETGE